MKNNFFKYLKQQTILKDRVSIFLVTAGFMLLIIEAIISLLRIEEKLIKVPIRFTEIGSGLENRGEWFNLYVFLLFATAVYIMNVVLAVRIHALHKGLANSLLAVTIFILSLSILVTWALTGAR